MPDTILLLLGTDHEMCEVASVCWLLLLPTGGMHNLCRSGCIQLKLGWMGVPHMTSWERVMHGRECCSGLANMPAVSTRDLCTAWLPVQCMLGLDKEQGISAGWKSSLPLPQSGLDGVSRSREF